MTALPREAGAFRAGPAAGPSVLSWLLCSALRPGPGSSPSALSRAQLPPRQVPGSRTLSSSETPVFGSLLSKRVRASLGCPRWLSVGHDRQRPGLSSLLSSLLFLLISLLSVTCSCFLKTALELPLCSQPLRAGPLGWALHLPGRVSGRDRGEVSRCPCTTHAETLPPSSPPCAAAAQTPGAGPWSNVGPTNPALYICSPIGPDGFSPSAGPEYRCFPIGTYCLTPGPLSVSSVLGQSPKSRHDTHLASGNIAQRAVCARSVPASRPGLALHTHVDSKSPVVTVLPSPEMKGVLTWASGAFGYRARGKGRLRRATWRGFPRGSFMIGQFWV